MDYNEYQYWWPPRPEQKIAKPMLGFYQKRGFVAQKKKNGTCTVIFAKGDQVIFKTRHNDDHKLWTPQADHIKFFSGSEGWNVYTAELLHSKVTGGPKNELFIFDQLVRDGVSLVGTTFASRVLAMRQKFGGEAESDQYRIADRITLAKCFTGGFTALFDTLSAEDEGLVLKDPNATLKACLKPDSNKTWQVKCRIAAANYSF
jgi:hypothetical protein